MPILFVHFDVFKCCLKVLWASRRSVACGYGCQISFVAELDGDDIVVVSLVLFSPWVVWRMMEVGVQVMSSIALFSEGHWCLCFLLV